MLHVFSVKTRSVRPIFFKDNLIGLPPHEVVFKKMEQSPFATIAIVLMHIETCPLASSGELHMSTQKNSDERISLMLLLTSQKTTKYSIKQSVFFLFMTKLSSL